MKTSSCNKSFCEIDSEEKAYKIVKLYYSKTQGIADPEEEQRVLLKIDNDLQLEEIRTHLYLNHIDEDHITEEEIEWIKQYSPSFRIYLNTLKILLLALEATNINVEGLSFDEILCNKKSTK
jgi:hypothetical protein